MRVNPDLVYNDYKDRVIGAFNLFWKKGWEKAENITNYLADEDDDLLIEDSTSLAIWIITIGEYEIRVHDQLCYQIPRFLDGVFDDDLSEEEHKQMQADVDYILSKVEIYNVVDSEDED